MAILKIARMGHPVLAGPAGPVDDPAASAIRRLVADMVETLADAGGIGLAAPQVHVPKRVLIFHIPPHRDGDEGAPAGGRGPEGRGRPLTVLVNPWIEPLGDEMDTDWEGCLSLPRLTGAVPRYVNIRYGGAGPNGETIEETASGFHARVVQHECDHLDGILYPRRMEDLSLFGFVDEMRRGGEENSPPPVPEGDL